ncbi:hypothetical protein V2J09_006355 [Rumex salicifolius]
MDATLRARRSLTAGGITDYTHLLSVKPVLGLSSYRPITRFLQSHACRVACPTNGASLQISASSDIPKKRTRKTPSSRATRTGPNPKEFTPEARAETGAQRGDKRRSDDGEISVTFTSGISERAPATEADDQVVEEVVNDIGMKVEGQNHNESNDEVEESSPVIKNLGGDNSSRLKQNGKARGNHDDGEGGSLSLAAGREQDSVYSSLSKKGKSRVGLQDEEECIVKLRVDERSPEEIEAQRVKELLQGQRLKQVIEELAQANFLKQKKMFTYPQVVKPGKNIKVFFNKTLSPLKEEPDVFIMGAFNDWCWKSFTTKMEKGNLNGDWWSCEIHVPEEAYQIDFVFFDGKDIYDNNNKEDFHITVEGGMDAVAFDNFLLEEKQKELELQAKEQEVKGRQEEQKRRIEEDRAAIEAHKAQAKAQVETEQAKLQELMKKAEKYVDNLWYLEVRESKDQNTVRLYYNRRSGPLAHANEIWIHAGINDWKGGLFISSKLDKSEKKDADWWYVDVSLPGQAFMLDWVFADGPPQKAIVYDNNNYQDFHAIIPKSIPEKQYWAEEEERIFQGLQEERRSRVEVLRAKAEMRTRMRAETKERTMKRFLMSQKHIVYTDPLEVQAGENVTVYYNPANTILNGKPEVWFKCSFNRWTHRKGPLAPQKMMPSQNGSHVEVTVKVPLDAYIMDFVFSDKQDGGIFDNKDGMDYHVPVFGGIAKESPMHIVHIAVEMAPIAKVGGLGDVVTSLSRAVQDMNHHVDIILPKYDCLKHNNVKDLHYERSYYWGGTEIKIWFGEVESLSVYFLEPCNGYFWTGCIYGCTNDADRFSFFCHAALEFLQQNGSHPDIIHCHDWSSAPVAWLFKDHYQQYGLSKTRVVFTIHNLEFGADLIAKAMTYTDKATTVSYTSENVIEGKRAAKKALQIRLGLKVVDLPLVGVISRLTHQKGIYLIKHAIGRTLERNGQFVLLGSAPDPRIQNDFVNFANNLHSAHGDCAHLCLTYDEPLSHLIYAAADFILVPSLFEPCGLTQLVAMRYGAIPVVRKTGGLHDTVFDVDHDKERAQAQGIEPNGFNFEGADASGIDYALNRAITAWFDGREWFQSLCKRVVEQDWSWNRPALDYLELYHAVRKL